jgi:Siphovirus Gp157
MPDIQIKRQNLFDLDAELDQIAMAFDQLADTGEDTAVLESIENYFAGLLEDRDAKIDAYCRLIDRFNSYAAIRTAEAKRISALAKSDENAAKRLKDRLKAFLESKNMARIETPLHKVWVQNNGGSVPIVFEPGVEEDATCLPEAFRKIVYVPNETALRTELGIQQAIQSHIDALTAEFQAWIEGTPTISPDEITAKTKEMDDRIQRLKDELAQTVDLSAYAKLGDRGTHLRIK